MKKVRALVLAAAGLAVTHGSGAQEPTETAEKIQAALALDYRTEADRARDRNRRPAQALELMGLRDDMSVFEFGPGNGWYTKILAPVLKDEGQLHIGYRAEWLAELDETMEAPEMAEVRKVALDMDWNDDVDAFEFDGMDFKASKLDMFLNIREYHNLHGEERAEFNEAVFAALKPGGTYVVIDHTRRHMQDDNDENWRREDPVTVLLEVLEAGFELKEHSDMFYRPDDTLEYEVGRRTVSGNTDRFFFVFQKPA
ncbi:MAG: methyltransferase [Pseudomonadota bacterium]